MSRFTADIGQRVSSAALRTSTGYGRLTDTGGRSHPGGADHDDRPARLSDRARSPA